MESPANTDAHSQTPPTENQMRNDTDESKVTGSERSGMERRGSQLQSTRN